MFDQTVMAVMDRVDALRHQVDDHWQIPRQEALVLAQLVRAARCVSICEIGHSYGFSTLHLAAAARDTGGHVHAFDVSQKKHHAAARHLEEAGLRQQVTLHLGDARQTIPSVQPRQPYDFTFIDAVKEQSPAYLDAILPQLAAHTIIATDNTSTHAEQLRAFVQRLRSLEQATSCEVPVGNGFELTVISRGA